MRARDIMHRDAVVLTPTDDIMRAAEQMKYERDACLPIVNDRTHRVLVGVITARDIVTRHVARHHDDACVTSDHMTPAPLCVANPDDDVDTIATKLAESDVRRLPVVDDDGVLLGMVTESDVHRVLEGIGLIGHHAAAIPACG